MKCNKCGFEFDEGVFCPNCGTKQMEDNEITCKEPAPQLIGKEKKKSNKLIFLVLIAIIVVIVKMCSGKSDGKETVDKSDSMNKILDQLDATVTEDYLPGTYRSNDGKIFAIKVYDESILNVNTTLATIFQGQDYSICEVITPDVGWYAEGGWIDMSDKEISIPGEGDDEILYYFDFDKTIVSIEDEEGNKTKYKKISDEFNKLVVSQAYPSNIEDIVGTYVYKEESLLNYNDYVVHIEMVNEKSVNIYVFRFYNDSDELVPYLCKENVDIKEFVENEVNDLENKASGETGALKMINRFSVSLKGQTGTAFKLKQEYDGIEQAVENFEAFVDNKITQTADESVEKENAKREYEKSEYIAFYGCILDDISYEYGEYNTYFLYDIDKDGVKDLIVCEGASEADMRFHAYTIINSELINLGSVDGGNCMLYLAGEGRETADYVMKVRSHMGEESRYEVRIQDGQFVEEEIPTVEGVGAFEGDPVPYAEVSNQSLLTAE